MDHLRSPLASAARHFSWRIGEGRPNHLSAADLDHLLAWCRRQLAADRWYFPLPGRRSASGNLDPGQWGFADRNSATAFARHWATLPDGGGEAPSIYQRDAIDR